HFRVLKKRSSVYLKLFSLSVALFCNRGFGMDDVRVIVPHDEEIQEILFIKINDKKDGFSVVNKHSDDSLFQSPLACRIDRKLGKYPWQWYLDNLVKDLSNDNYNKAILEVHSVGYRTSFAA